MTQKFASPDTEAPERLREERNAELPDFFKMADLVGRHVLIKPEKIENIPDGKYGPYDKLIAEYVIVLDGPKDELFPELPRWQRNVWIFDGDVVVELKPFLNPKDREHYGLAALGYVAVDKRTKKLILKDGTTDPDIVKKAEAALERYEAGESARAQADQEPPF